MQPVSYPCAEPAVPPSARPRVRKYPATAAMALAAEGVHPLLARVLAARGLCSRRELGESLTTLLPHARLRGAREAAQFLLDAIEAQRPIVVIADYDCDGATACAVAVRGLRAFGARVDYVVPDRMVHGYGLTPGVVELACERHPDVAILLTVDNGIASHAGVQAAVDRGLDVVVTDHHLPAAGRALPAARVIVDPSQPGCTFPSKALAGVGVIWYVLWAMQDLRKARGLADTAQPGFKVSQLLPLVAVGTVTDVVPLDLNNRTLVQAGLARIKAGGSFPAIEALAAPAWPGQPLRRGSANVKALLTSDIAFGIGPRINAAGRLKTMDVGIECLLCDDEDRAFELAQELAGINQERKDIEYETAQVAVEQAQALLDEAGQSWPAGKVATGVGRYTLAVCAQGWHAGVIGIVAGRLKEKHWRPTFVLSEDPGTGEVKGSGRSIPGFNLKDALDQVDKAHPGLMLKFGGHAMAAGLTLRAKGFEEFREAFEAQALRDMPEQALSQFVDHDGELSAGEIRADVVHALQGPTWGQMFPEPAFQGEFTVASARITGERKDQLALELEHLGGSLQAVRFRHDGPLPRVGDQLRLVYKMQVRHDRKGRERVVLLIDHVQDC